MRTFALALIVGWLSIVACCGAVGYTIWSLL